MVVRDQSSRLQRSHATLKRTAESLEATQERLDRANKTLAGCCDTLGRSDHVLRRRDMVSFAQPSMPRPPSSDPTTPVHHCPVCRQTLTFHNQRIEPEPAKPVRVGVYLCIHHGFFHVRGNEPLQPGM